MPTNIARAIVFPALQDFLKQHPKGQVELGVNDRLIDLIQEGYDAVIRLGELKDSRLIARHIYTVRYITCAAPAYLAQYGEPKTPADLLKHNCIWATPAEWQEICQHMVVLVGKWHEQEQSRPQKRLQFCWLNSQ